MPGMNGGEGALHLVQHHIHVGSIGLTYLLPVSGTLMQFQPPVKG